MSEIDETERLRREALDWPKPLSVRRLDDQISIHSQGATRTYSLRDANELLQALVVVCLHGQSSYENEAHVEWRTEYRDTVRAAEAREREMRATFRIPSNVRPKTKLEDI